mgnify:FL=1
MEKLCISVDELRGQLGISRCTAYQLVKRDDFPKIRLDRRILIPIEALKKWIAENAQQQREAGAL